MLAIEKRTEIMIQEKYCPFTKKKKKETEVSKYWEKGL